LIIKQIENQKKKIIIQKIDFNNKTNWKSKNKQEKRKNNFSNSNLLLNFYKIIFKAY
jgi:hypothetical protein